MTKNEFKELKNGEFINHKKHIDFNDFKEFYEEIPKSVHWVVDKIPCKNCSCLFSKNSKVLKKSLETKKGHEWENDTYCSIFCFNKYMHNYKEWRENNSKAQLKIQGTEEQKEKNRQGVLRSRKDPEKYKKWIEAVRKNAEREEYRKKISISSKKKWEDPEYREKMYNNGKFYTSIHGDFYSLNSGIIRFESSYEFLYLFIKDIEGIEIKRFDKPINYLLNDKQRRYFPDFIENKKIIEIKSHAILNKKENGLYMQKQKEIALQNYINNSELYDGYKVLYEENLTDELKINTIWIRKYLFSWAEENKIIQNVYGGKSLKIKCKPTDIYKNNSQFNEAKEIWNKWNSLKLKKQKQNTIMEKCTI